MTYSGGLSRGYVRTYGPARKFGFDGFSPLMSRAVMAVSEAIPFIELTGWEHQRLYDLKGAVVAAGVKAVTGIDMPIFPKRRFQHGATTHAAELFPSSSATYRQIFQRVYEAGAALPG